MDDRFEMKLPEPFRGMAKDIADQLKTIRPEIARDTSMAEAIRYAISFTHKQLTEVLNPEDLRDDDLS